MLVLFAILLVLAVVCFLASAFQVHSVRFHLLSLGLALAFAVPLIKALQKL